MESWAQHVATLLKPIKAVLPAMLLIVKVADLDRGRPVSRNVKVRK